MQVGLSAGVAGALATLNSAQRAQSAALETVSTGREVNTAKDDAARWSIGQLMASEQSGYSAEARVLALKQSTVTVERTQAEGAVNAARFEMKGGLVEAQLSGASAEDLGAVLTDQLDAVNSSVDLAAAAGAEERALSTQAEFKQDLQNALASGVSAVTDADIEKASVEQKQAQLQSELALRAQAIVNETQRNSISELF